MTVIVKKLNDGHSNNDIKTKVSEIMDDLNVHISGKKILLKPNFVCPRPCATTSMELIRSIIEILSPRNQLILAEGSGYEFDTDKTFEILGVNELGKEYDIQIINLRKEKTREVDIGGKVLKKIHLPEIVFDIDGIINIPKLKTHALTNFTFAMKNLFGLLGDEARKKAHVWGLNQSIVDVAKYFAGQNLLTIGDGINVMTGKGPAFGDIVTFNLLFGGKNNFAIDRMTADLFGFSFDSVKYIKLASDQKILDKSIGQLNEKSLVVDIPKPNTSSFYHFLYWSVYAFDFIISPMTKKSLIPKIITRFGTQVEIKKNKCTECNKCIKACKIGAISTDLVVDFKKCRYVRCFRCYDICQAGAVAVRGYSKPKYRS